MPQRESGILLHPTSLPGPFGVGDLGPAAWSFADALADAGVAVWQMLPLTAPGAHGSPYDCRSAFAGNWLLISPQALRDEGLLPDLPSPPAFPATAVDLAAARAFKEEILRSSWAHFQRCAAPGTQAELEAFKGAETQRGWLEDWTLFIALAARNPTSWLDWPEGLRRRDPHALAKARRELAAEVDYQAYLQFLFFRQLAALRRHARDRGLRLCGDLPMYLSHQSADVWAHPDLFELDATGRSLAVAGVPPDAFSTTGQHWGNPVYDWRRHRETGFCWWIERLRAQARWVDLLRLDHFRGYVAYFKIPAGAEDARHGRWARGPGRRLFAALAREVDGLELVAEDLGLITPAVHKLRRQFDLPGMKVLQFGFGDLDSEHLPHHYAPRSVAYSGTHDNDTLAGWFAALDGETKERVIDYLGLEPPVQPRQVAWQLACIVLRSVSELAILPIQDVLGLGSEARMNTPGTAYDNWRWRLDRDSFDAAMVERLRRLVTLTGRRRLDIRTASD